MNALTGSMMEQVKPSFSFCNRVERLLFRTAWLLLARWTWNGANAWRLALLRAFGAKIGRGVRIGGSVKIWLPRNLIIGQFSTLGPFCDCYSMAPITIGEYTIVSQRAVLCAGTHDFEDAKFPLVAKPIEIGSNVWIAAEAFVCPGTRIEDGAVLGARGCAFGHLSKWTVYAGNPARALRPRNLRV
ncbi:putative colanic acid biosynthesis acetyltransferase [Bradyrhizobium sp. Y36]|nr:putative colanic acid biosynthesis acetyltransferase [Bradyrhizobium sp. Y36]